jgi:hypothetical protein
MEHRHPAHAVEQHHPLAAIRMVVQPAAAKKMPFFLQILVFFIIFASGKGR